MPAVKLMKKLNKQLRRDKLSCRPLTSLDPDHAKPTRKITNSYAQTKASLIV